jgi:hypothetical protein
MRVLMRHEVVIPFNPHRTRETLKHIGAPVGPLGAVYLAYDPEERSALCRASSAL